MKLSKHQVQKERANAMFGLYYELGPGRSLQILHDKLAYLGLKLALNTLKTYSVQGQWQSRVIEMDAKVKIEQERNQVNRIIKMNEEQALAGRLMRSIGTQEFARLQRRVQKAIDMAKEKGKNIDLAFLSPEQAATLIIQGSRVERMAMGQPTERKEMVVTLWNVFAVQVAPIFKEAMAQAQGNTDKAAEIFADKFDELGKQYQAQIGSAN